MTQLNVKLIALAIGLALSSGAMAQSLSNGNYKAAQKNIAAEYKAAKVACKAFSDNALDICLAEANGRESVAKASLESQYKPSEQASYKVRLARAHAAYALAKEKCDDSAGNVKAVCVKEARAAEVTARSNAKAHMKTAMAHDVANAKSASAQIMANEKTAAAQHKANEDSAAARNDAAAEKRRAAYAVAKEKCDALAGGAKVSCDKDADARFGKR